MRVMRYRRQIVVSTAALLSSGGLFPLSALADEPVANLYVSPTHCSDTGVGTQALPFCTVQAAADVVNPGQTVTIGVGRYTGSVTITRSGTPTAPITFKSPAFTSHTRTTNPILWRPDNSTAAAVTVSGAHDIRIAGIIVEHARGDGLAVVGSTRIALDTNAVGQVWETAPETPDGISVDHTSSDVSITRNETRGSLGHGVSIASGAERVTVASNLLSTDQAGGIGATDVSGLTVTGNTIIAGSCSPGLSITGTSSGTVENNAVKAMAPSGTPPCTAAPLITVATSSTNTVKTAYNALAAAAPRFDYTWGGTDYTKAADLAAAVPGQAGQDLDVPATDISTSAQPEGSPLIDSGDSHAPGVTSTDCSGHPQPVDDPNTANTGTGAGAMDRGAFERQSTLTLAPSYSPASAAGTVPFTLAVTAAPTDSWGETVSTVVDFGDGGGPVAVSGGVASHVYPTPGIYTARTTATNTDGLAVTRTTQVKAATVDAPQVVLTAAPLISAPPQNTVTPGMAAFTTTAGADTWQLQSGTLTFGDGTSAELSTSAPTHHIYPHAGTYTATVTANDLLGRTSTASATITVGNEILPLTPKRIYDSRYGSRVPAHGTVQLSRAQLHADSTGVQAACLTVTVTNTKAGGFLTVYPDGTARPSVSLLNFGPGQTVPNIMMAVPGEDGLVDFYNGSSALVDLIIDSFGVEVGGDPASRSSQIGVTYSAAGPARVLDTRDGTGAPKAPVAPHGGVVLTVAGRKGVPSDASAVLLNVATTDTKAGGFLTAYGHGDDNPGTSNSNWTPGQTVSNLVLVPVKDGKVVLYNGSGGTVSFVADVVGYYDYPGTASVVVPTSLTRVLDTRTGTGTGGGAAKLGPHQTVRLQIANRNGVPATGMTAAELNMTVTNNVGGGFITAYPAGTARPTASNINFSAGQTVANASVMPTGTDGAIEFYNGSSSPVDLVVDLSGYYYGYTR